MSPKETIIAFFLRAEFVVSCEAALSRGCRIGPAVPAVRRVSSQAFFVPAACPPAIADRLGPVACRLRVSFEYGIAADTAQQKEIACGGAAAPGC